MASTFLLKKKTGALTGTYQPENNVIPDNSSSMSYMHLTKDDVANNGATSYQGAGAQITVPTSGFVGSMTAWFEPRWYGAFNDISAPKVWKSSGSLGTGIKIRAALQTTYAQPVVTLGAAGQVPDSDVNNIPTAEGSALVPTLTHSGANPTRLCVAQHVVLQMSVQSTAGPGDVGEQQYTVKWTES